MYPAARTNSGQLDRGFWRRGTVGVKQSQEADIFRKAMGSHRSHAKMLAERGKFVGSGMRTGLTEGASDELFRQCSAFAEFGFARAHAAAFAKISYDTAWLKRYYPAHYTTGVLYNRPMGFYSPAVVINDAKRHGIPVLPIDVNESTWEHDTRRMPGGSFGLRRVKGIDEQARATLDRERASGPFAGVRDFVSPHRTRRAGRRALDQHRHADNLTIEGVRGGRAPRAACGDPGASGRTGARQIPRLTKSP